MAFLGRNGKFFFFAVATFLLAGQSVLAAVIPDSKELAGTTVFYDVVLPNGYSPENPYPAVLAFPGGSQDIDTVDSSIERNWVEEAERRGYIVVMPAAPDGSPLYQRGSKIFPDFLIELLHDYNILGNKFHAAGASFGGLSAFHIASQYPQYFWSVTGFPGYLRHPTPEGIRALSKLCVNMFVGEYDGGWLHRMEQEVSDFRIHGLTVQFSIEKGQNHGIRTLQGAGASRLFDQFQDARRGCPK